MKTKKNIGFDLYLYLFYTFLIPFNSLLQVSGSGTLNRYLGFLIILVMLFSYIRWK